MIKNMLTNCMMKTVTAQLLFLQTSKNVDHCGT